MRSIVAFLFAMSLSITVKAQEPYAIEHLDSLVTMYEIIDGEYDGYLVYEVHGSCKVVTQVSETDFTTNLENYGIWCGDDITGHVPNEQDDPLIMALEDIRIAGRTYPGSGVTEEKAQEIFLAFWYETTAVPCVRDILQKAEEENLNMVQLKVAVSYFVYAYGVPFARAQEVTRAMIHYNKLPYNQLGITKVPNPARAVLREMYRAGPTYFD
jgi:hypothetical protein